MPVICSTTMNEMNNSGTPPAISASAVARNRKQLPSTFVYTSAAKHVGLSPAGLDCTIHTSISTAGIGRHHRYRDLGAQSVLRNQQRDAIRQFEFEPISRPSVLAPEIILEIFKHAPKSVIGTGRTADMFALSVTQVCRSWRGLRWPNPQLWASISWQPTEDDAVERTQRFAPRSGCCTYKGQSKPSWTWTLVLAFPRRMYASTPSGNSSKQRWQTNIGSDRLRSYATWNTSPQSEFIYLHLRRCWSI